MKGRVSIWLPDVTSVMGPVVSVMLGKSWP